MTHAPIRYGPAAWRALLRGAGVIAGVLRPTLGPLGGVVAITPLRGPDSPEMLGHAATIARRLIALADPYENAGAMLLRHAVWKVVERVGDGGATTAVLGYALLRSAVQLASAGWDTRALDQAVTEAGHTVVESLGRLARPVESVEQLRALAHRLIDDPELGRLLADAVDAVGSDGVVLVEESVEQHPACVYEEGAVWDAGVLSGVWLRTQDAVARVVEPALLLVDGEIKEAWQLVPFLERCHLAGVRRLVVIASGIRDEVLGVLIRNQERGVFEQVLGLQAPSVGWQQQQILEDLAALTGGQVVHCAGGESLSDAPVAVLGGARSVWATRWRFGILGGRGDRARIRARLQAARFALTTADDLYQRQKARERIARLTGVTARLRVGGVTQRDREGRRLAAEAAVAALQAALAGGLVPGGGIALVAASHALGNRNPTDLPVRLAVDRMFQRALAEPLCAIVRNAGGSPGAVLADVPNRCPQQVFDVVQQTWVDPWATALLDPLLVVQAAVDTATSLVRMVLSTSALIHRTWPAVASEP